MKRTARVIVAALALLTAKTLHAEDRPYSMLYVFGDSYSDTGAGYVDSDGPTAVAYLAQRLHIPFTYFGDPHSQGKGLNFAVSGARTGFGEGEHYPHGELFSRGMRNQVDDFAALVKNGAIRFDAAQTMFFFAGGLNDRALPNGATVANIEGEIDTLYALGARRFMVALLPAKIAAFATAGTRFNPQLAIIPAAMRANIPTFASPTASGDHFSTRLSSTPPSTASPIPPTPARRSPRKMNLPGPVQLLRPISTTTTRILPPQPTKQ